MLLILKWWLIGIVVFIIIAVIIRVLCAIDHWLDEPGKDNLRALLFIVIAGACVGFICYTFSKAYNDLKEQDVPQHHMVETKDK